VSGVAIILGAATDCPLEIRRRLVLRGQGFDVLVLGPKRHAVHRIRDLRTEVFSVRRANVLADIIEPGRCTFLISTDDISIRCLHDLYIRPVSPARKARKAYLLEMNMRSTQIAHLSFDSSTDVIEALSEWLLGRKTTAPVPSCSPSQAIALFPRVSVAPSPLRGSARLIHLCPGGRDTRRTARHGRLPADARRDASPPSTVTSIATRGGRRNCIAV